MSTEVLRSCHSGVGVIPETFRPSATPERNGNRMPAAQGVIEWEWNWVHFALSGLGID